MENHVGENLENQVLYLLQKTKFSFFSWTAFAHPMRTHFAIGLSSIYSPAPGIVNMLERPNLLKALKNFFEANQEKRRKENQAEKQIKSKEEANVPCKVFKERKCRSRKEFSSFKPRLGAIHRKCVFWRFVFHVSRITLHRCASRSSRSFYEIWLPGRKRSVFVLRRLFSRICDIVLWGTDIQRTFSVWTIWRMTANPWTWRAL